MLMLTKIVKTHKLMPSLALVLCASMLITSCGSSSPSALQDTQNDKIKIGSFNLLRLGYGSTKDFSRIAKIIRDANFDILAAQEVMTEDGAHDLLDALNHRSRTNWAMLFSKTATGESNYKEHFAIYYKEDIVSVKTRGYTFCSSGKAYSYLDGGCFARDYRRVEGQPDFSRDPFVGQFKFNDNEIALIVNHIHYGSRSKEDIEQRQHELMNVKKLMLSVQEEAPDALVTALGDFNLNISNQPYRGNERWAPQIPENIPAEFFEEEKPVFGLIDEKTTIGRSSYDHFFFFDEDYYCAPVSRYAKVYEADKLNSSSERMKFKKEVSDHFPIGVTIKCD
jgi:endonuclease/exonuclease/phosphatase family metal-dependent hydrolase